VGPGYEVVLGAVSRPSLALPPAARGACSTAGGRAWWPVILRHLGRGHGRSPDHRPHWRLLSPRGWGETHESRRDRQLYGVVEITGISVRRLRQQEIATSGVAVATRPGAPRICARQIWQGPISEKRPRTHFRRGRGARARPATRCTALHGVAIGLSTPGNDPGYQAHDWPTEPANHGSDGAVHCEPPTVAIRYQRCLPARRACRAAPTLPAGASGPEPDPPNRPPAVPTRTDLARAANFLE
jgi:hypothetical protein